MIALQLEGVKRFGRSNAAVRAAQPKVTEVKSPTLTCGEEWGFVAIGGLGSGPKVGVAAWVFLSASLVAEAAVSRAVWLPGALAAVVPSAAGLAVEAVPRVG